MKKYMETRKAIKALVIEIGLGNINGHHMNALNDQGHSYGNIQDALSYFRYSPTTAKYR